MSSCSVYGATTGKKELNENLSQEKSRLAEEAFFRTSPKFGKLDPSLFGLNNLTTINELLLIFFKVFISYL